MIKKRVDLITSVEELSEHLGEDFVIFAGSAISGVASPFLAMAGTVTDGITRQLSTKTPKNYVDYLYSKYAESLLDDGPYGGLLQSTKFEEFLWLLSKASSRRELDDLLYKLYNCSKQQYGPNHMAIAALLATGRCKACFTTNFDNALELACESAGVNLDRYVEPGNYPSKLPERCETPALIKLHGDAEQKNCVAQSTLLLAAQSQEIHGVLKDLISDQQILVVGYSGRGDIDISPHLGNSNATFFWANHSHPVSHELPDWADYVVLSDLRYTKEPKTPPNLLIQLAGTQAVLRSHFENHQNVDLILVDWLKHTNLDSRRLIKSLFEWRQAEPLLHVCHEELAHTDQIPAYHDYGWACVQRRAYKTAQAVFIMALKNKSSLREFDYLSLEFGRAFALWRMGKLETSRERLEKLINESAGLVITKGGTVEQDLIDLISNIYRVYLEVSRDLLRLVPGKARESYAAKWKLRDRLAILHGLSFSSPQGKLLAALIGHNIDWLLGKQIKVADIRKLCDISLDSMYPTTAWAALDLLTQMSICEGLRQYRKLDHILTKAGIGHYRWKNRQSFFSALFVRFSRPLGTVGFHAAKFLIKWYHLFLTDVVEWRYKRQLRRWSKARAEWAVKNPEGTPYCPG